MKSPKLPHLRDPGPELPPFVSVDQEIAYIHSKTHPSTPPPSEKEDASKSDKNKT
jgi:hypothetical protein